MSLDGSRDARLSQAKQFAVGGLERHASQICLDLLADDPGDPDASGLLGHLLLRSGRTLPALLLLERATAQSPMDALLRCRLAEAHLIASGPAAAQTHYEQALALTPTLTEALLGLAASLEVDDRNAEASEFLRKATLEDPRASEPWVRLTQVLEALSDHEGASVANARALELDPQTARRHLILALHRYTLGLKRAGLLAVTRARVFFPDDPQLEHLEAAWSGSVLARAGDRYVEAYFDEFADTFEKRLRDELQYGVPEVVDQMLLAIEDPIVVENALDAGCGTGLCGPLLRRRARHLAGVDLSKRMLELAAQSGHYDELLQGELTAVLPRFSQSFDLVVAADVVIYFGELDTLFAAVAAKLKAGGLFVYSTEAAESGLVLQGSGRWAHGRDVEQAAAELAGFTEVACETITVRLEFGSPIPGRVTVLRAG